MRRGNTRSCRGFTLLEMLIVVAVIAVLVAVAIPTFTSSMTKARIAVCQANMRSLKAELTMTYMLEDTLPRNIEGTVDLTDAQKKTYACPSGGIITAVLSDGAVTVRCSKHNASMSDANTMKDLMNTFNGAIKQYVQQTGYNASIVDSGALAVSGSGTSYVTAAMKKADLDLAAAEVTTWQYRTEGKNNYLFWTEQDVSELQKGDPLTLYCYNFTTGKYAVCDGKVGTSSTAADGNKRTYNIISGPNTNSLKFSYAYDEALAEYKTKQSGS